VAIPDPSINVQTQGGDSAFENVFVFGKLNYEFSKDDLEIRSIDIKEPSFFQKNVTLSGDLNLTGNAAIVGDVSLDELNARNANFTGITTTNGDLMVLGPLKDRNGNSGSGKILSSTGNGIEWIAANTTSVNNSINVGVNEDGTNANQFVSFFGANSGNQPNRVDNEFTYNPSTNTLSVGTISATNIDGVGAFVQGMIILWYGDTSNVPTGFVLCDGSNSTPDLRDRFVIGAGNNFSAGSTGGNNSLTLTEANLPSHQHFVVSNDLGGANRTNSNVSANNQVRKGTGAGNIYETYNLASTGSGANAGRSSSVGSGTPIDNKPSYHALCYIMKT